MKLLILLFFILLTQIIAWFQTYGQVKWVWMKEHFYLVVLLGIPISILWMKSAAYAFELFDGKTWPMRFIGFAVGVIVFTIFSKYFLNEVMTTKTIMCLTLSLLILIIQIWF